MKSGKRKSFFDHLREHLANLLDKSPEEARQFLIERDFEAVNGVIADGTGGYQALSDQFDLGLAGMPSQWTEEERAYLRTASGGIAEPAISFIEDENFYNNKVLAELATTDFVAEGEQQKSILIFGGAASGKSSLLRQIKEHEAGMTYPLEDGKTIYVGGSDDRDGFRCFYPNKDHHAMGGFEKRLFSSLTRSASSVLNTMLLHAAIRGERHVVMAGYSGGNEKWETEMMTRMAAEGPLHVIICLADPEVALQKALDRFHEDGLFIPAAHVVGSIAAQRGVIGRVNDSEIPTKVTIVDTTEWIQGKAKLPKILQEFNHGQAPAEELIASAQDIAPILDKADKMNAWLRAQAGDKKRVTGDTVRAAAEDAKKRQQG